MSCTQSCKEEEEEKGNGRTFFPSSVVSRGSDGGKRRAKVYASRTYWPPQKNSPGLALLDFQIITRPSRREEARFLGARHQGKLLGDS